MNSMHSDEIVRAVQKDTESKILKQLNGMVEKGLLVIEMTQATLYAEMGLKGRELFVGQEVTLTLKDQEYITKLEAENERLRTLCANSTFKLADS